MAIAVDSYRSVFDLERRIYRIDKLRLNPSGVPVRGVAYFTALLLVALMTAAVPLLGTVVGLLPWYLRDLVLPAGGAALFAAIRIEGRPFHLVAWALVRYVCGPSRLLGYRPAPRSGRGWCPPAVLLLPDGSEGRLRRLRCTGPGTVAVRVAHERIEWRAGRLAGLGQRERVTVRELPDRRPLRRAQVTELRGGTRLGVVGAARAPAHVAGADEGVGQ
jgi:hypothetical protein